MKGIYLAAYKANHEKYNIIYQDINGKRDIDGDMLEVDLENYDFIIATPPCNYYSRANYRRNQSKYSLETKHLLPSILKKLGQQNKPFIVENVRNDKLFKLNGIYDIANKYNIWIYYIGRHTYFTNIMINLNCKQEYDFKHIKNHGVIRLNKNTQGGENVKKVIEIWLKYITRNDNNNQKM